MEIINEVYSIKEMSEIIGYKPHVIRYYEKEFQLDIPRNENNRRFFTYKELEQFRYIKTLKSKGLTNKQIKQILKSPEIIVDEDYNINALQEMAVSAVDCENLVPLSGYSNEDFYNILKELFENIQNIDYKGYFEDLNFKIDELQNQIVNQERDVLVCENVKLKMNMKEKSYEIAELKEKLRREKSKKTSIFTRVFGTK